MNLVYISISQAFLIDVIIIKHENAFGVINIDSLYVVVTPELLLRYEVIALSFIPFTINMTFIFPLSAILPSMICLDLTVCMTYTDKTFEGSEAVSCIGLEIDHLSGQTRPNVYRGLFYQNELVKSSMRLGHRWIIISTTMGCDY